MKIFILIEFLCCCVLAKDDMDIFHLPTSTIPLFYDLQFLNVLSDNFTYSGTTKIKIQAQQTTSVLTLNVVDLDIESIKIFDIESKREIEVNNHELVEKNEQLKVYLNEQWLITGRQYQVEIVYNSKLRTDMTGLYRSSYRDEEYNKTRWLAVSHFKPTHARKAFPCYDEPIYKTPFHITIIRKDTQISLSNYPINKSWASPIGNLIYDDYKVSEPLPTYLVAISVSEFVTKPSDEKRIHVYTHKEYINQTDYIRQRAAELLHLMELFTTIPYSVEKMDFLAVPNFVAGAIFGENWGLNTYQEKYLLISENSTEKSKELVTTTVQHKLAHQWFGNIVTCSWWDYVWLHESFATFFQYFAVKIVEPEWRMEDLFVVEQHQIALSYDQVSRHSMTVHVKSPDEITDIFDEIVYEKGASILRMLKHIITDHLFRQSLILYLNTNKYKNTKPKDMWDSIDSVLYEADYKLTDNIQIRDFMRSWTENEGYPIINVAYQNKKSYSVTQKRFLIGNNTSSSKSKWLIGLTYTTQIKKEFYNLKPTEWLKINDNEKTLQINDEGWFIFNLQSTGFYRVNYDDENWSRLIKQLKFSPKDIHVLNRAQLIDDSFNLAKAGELPISTSFNLISYLEKEDDFIPWYTAINELTYINNQMRRCSIITPYLKNFTRNLASIIYNRVYNLYEKSNDRRHTTVTSYDAFSSWACKLEVPECEMKALEYFKKWQKEKYVPADIKEATLCTGIRHGDETEWNEVFNLYQTTQTYSERQAAQLALSCSKNITLLNSYLRLLLQEDNSSIHQTYFKLIFNSLALTPIGIEMMTIFLKENINEYLNKTQSAYKTIESMYAALVKNAATASEIYELNLIRNQTTLPLSLQKTFNKLYKEIEINSDYYERTHKSLQDWLTQSVIPETNSCTSSYYISIIILLFNLFFYILYFF
ncbi:aminopeptidase N-like [Daktulosphaira vitifoliae]|uniref:aminopeptidase N-like n=1 Tax=Daktulosphaira vitifoliae TaxID=58002 RepID=UPI0021AA10F3|nr:aminopeptidase N-like [Daktulosphaira vitifoliae]